MAIVELQDPKDIHVHFRSPGAMHKETPVTGTRAALVGGYGAVVDMPNAPALVDTPESLQAKIDLYESSPLFANVGFNFLATKTPDRDSTQYFDQVKDKVIAYKLFMNQSTGGHGIDDSHAIEEIFEAVPNGKVLMLHAEKDKLREASSYAKKYGTKIHACHLTGSQVDIVRDALNDGVDITAGVTPHHLFLEYTDTMRRLGAFGKMLPGLENEVDQDQLLYGIRNGFVHMLESDHAPHTKQEKLSKDAPYGVPVIEQSIPLLFKLRSWGAIGDDQIVQLLHTNATKRFNIPTDPGTKTFVDTEAGYRVEDKDLQTKPGWSPFTGWYMEARVVKVQIAGRTAYENGIISDRPLGKVIYPKAA